MTGKWTIKKLNRHDGRPLPMPWHAIPPHTPIPPRDLSHHSMRVLYEDDDVGTGVTHGEVMGYVNEQIRGGSMSTTPPREEQEMTTNTERAIEIIEDEHDPHLGPIDAPSLIYALNDAGLLMPDEDERLPSWVYDHPDVCTNPHRMGGQPCMRGTRVPVGIIFNLMDGPDGCTDEEITEFYPSVPTGAINRLRTAREEHDNV